MIWSDEISLEHFYKIVDDNSKKYFLGDPAIDAQFGLDLLYKTLIDDKENAPYITTMPENAEQVNCIMLHELLYKYSRKYRRFLKKKQKES